MVQLNYLILSSEGGADMSTVVRKHESLTKALRRFNRSVSRNGNLKEYRKREFYTKPSVSRKLKSQEARKRKNIRHHRRYHRKFY